MWSGGGDTNETGEPVLLLQPITGKQRHKKFTASPSSSHIGGLPCFYKDDLVSVGNDTECSICSQPMHLLLQLNAPLDDLDRTLYVFGCNRPSCHASYGGSEMSNCKFQIHLSRSPILCFRSQQSKIAAAKPQAAPEAAATMTNLKDNDWGDENDWGASDSDDEWGVSKTSDKTKEVSMDDLEAMISKCEMQSKNESTKIQSKSNEKPSKSANSSLLTERVLENAPSFPQYNLELFNEPSGNRKDHADSIDEDDDDDEDNSTNIDSNKVNQMLSRYLAMEDDEDILSVLKGGASEKVYASEKGTGGERYERVAPEERAFLAFSKRLKRAPLQVVRYAYGGVPLWSIPHLEPTYGQEERRVPKAKQKNNNQKQGASFVNKIPVVPPCTCGSQRVFELQLLPSLLHVLEVDSSASNIDDSMDLSSIGGMNWGAIAVYSCPNSCDESRVEVCIVQSGDEEVVKKVEGCAEEVDNDDQSMEELTTEENNA